MRDPRDLYSYASADVVAAVPRGRLTLVHALPGMVDAGNACRIAATYLRDALRHVRLVTFEADELVDYRGSRPQAVFDGRSYASVDIPEMALYLMYDESDRPFLFLDGPEPDLQWQRLAQAIIDLVEFFEVDQVVSMEAYPMAVPHTRPIALIAHANDGSLSSADAEGQEETEVLVPASFGALLEKELERAGHRAMGYAAQIPHYLTRTDFPAGALALLRRVSEAAGLELPLVELGDLTDAASSALAGTLEGNEEIGAVVSALEEQYDAVAGDGSVHGIATTMDLPTADEIGDHFERFLARQDDDPDPGRSPS